jgi:hypothetical protein
MEGWRKITKIFSQNSQSPGRDLNVGRLNRKQKCYLLISTLYLIEICWIIVEMKCTNGQTRLTFHSYINFIQFMHKTHKKSSTVLKCIALEQGYGVSVFLHMYSIQTKVPVLLPECGCLPCQYYSTQYPRIMLSYWTVSLPLFRIVVHVLNISNKNSLTAFLYYHLCLTS